MLFVEPRFIVFFAAVWLLYWGLRTNRSRKVWLLGASYLFYCGWDWRFLSLILASTLVDYTVGIMLGRLPMGVGAEAKDQSHRLLAGAAQGGCATQAASVARRKDWLDSRLRGNDGARAASVERARKAWLIVSVVANLGILGFFKYFNFFIESAVSFSATLGLPLSTGTMNIILPVGISFYTFQTMSYSIDVYRGRLAPSRSLLDVALFVGFFPQLVAGPIVRASEFLPQLDQPRRFGGIRVRDCLILFLIGYFKKACVSDNLAPVIDAFFAEPERYTWLSAWVATSFYAVQIYCDFSGYSDMAIACAGLLGYRLCENFNFPYFASSVTDFWRRWHMSLSTWLRDYLYIPLGGSRGGRLFTYRNLLLTMLLGGLWHGAAWNFVIWGGLHGVALVAHKEWTRHGGNRLISPWLWRPLAPILTFAWVCIAWVFFRSPDFATAMTVLESALLLRSAGTASIGVDMWWVLPALLACHWLAYKRFLIEHVRRMAEWSFAAWYGLATSMMIAFVPTQYRAFIYFQF